MFKIFSRKDGGKDDGMGSHKGFTLIELLVVIAIIGILASIVLASLNTARKKSRDARRVADLNQLRLAEELYFDSNSGSYSATLAALSAVNSCGTGSTCIAQIPTPGTQVTQAVSNTYDYCVGAPATVYGLRSGLEIGVDKPNNAITSVGCTLPGGQVCGVAGDTNYCVGP